MILSLQKLMLVPQDLTPFRDVRMEVEGNDFFGFILNTNGQIIRLEFGTDPGNISPIISSFADIDANVNNLSLGLDFEKDGTIWYGFVADFSSFVHRVVFDNLCGESISTSSAADPPALSYSSSGDTQILLEARNEAGVVSQQVQSLTINSNQAPTINFSLPESQCLTSPSTFIPISTGSPITSFNWDFQQETSTQETPTIRFDTAGTYIVRLDVEAQNGCSNFLSNPIEIFEEPIANFSFPSGAICTNTSIDFINNSQIFGAEDVIQYSWDFDNDGIEDSNESNPSFIFSEGGPQTVSLTTSIPGCESFFSTNVVITPGPNVNFSFEDICLGETVQFLNNTTDNNITGFQWDFGDGTQSTLENPSLEYQQAGSFNVELTATNSDGCITSSTQVIQVSSIPQSGFFFDLACENNEVQFTDNTQVSNANISDFLWEFGDDESLVSQLTSTEENPVITFNQTGSFPVQLTTVSSFGCVDSATINVIVFDSPELNLAIESLCLNDSAEFADLSSVNAPERLVSRIWEVNGISTEDSILRTQFLQTGLFDVSLSVSSSNFCVADTSFQVEVSELPTQELLASQACDNEATQFSDLTSNPSDPIVSRLWNFNGLGTSSSQNVSFQFPNSGDFNVSLLSETENGCLEDTSFVVSVLPAPEADFSARSLIGGAPFVVDFINESEDGNSFQWDFGFNNGTSNEFEPSFYIY